MSIRLGRAVLALLSPEPRGLSQLLPGDELRVLDREPSFQGSALILAGVGRGRGANSSVFGLSRGLMRQRGSGSGIGGAGAFRRWGTGKMVEGSGRRGMSRVSSLLLLAVLCGAPGGGGMGMLPSEGDLWCPRV